jgi:putative sigma-54 modulation protein
MQVNVTFKHVESNSEVRQRAEEKAQKIRKFLRTPINVNFVFSQDKLDHIAELTVSGDGAHLVASVGGDDYFSAIDDCMDKMLIQLKKYKEKNKQKKGNVKVSKEFIKDE